MSVFFVVVFMLLTLSKYLAVRLFFCILWSTLKKAWVVGLVSFVCYIEYGVTCLALEFFWESQQKPNVTFVVPILGTWIICGRRLS